MKRVLMLASVASMIDQFNIPNLLLLQELGYQVDVACNFIKGNSCTEEKIIQLKYQLDKMGINYFQIDFVRNISNLKENIFAYRQLSNLVRSSDYTFIHCHSPVGGAIGRLVAHKYGVKVIYTAHGFHFYKGANAKNWLLFYPIEKFLSNYTDVLITINKEDYSRASTFYSKKVNYVPGVGIDTAIFSSFTKEKKSTRDNLHIAEDEILLLSFGSSSSSEDYISVFEAMAKIRNTKLKYIIINMDKCDDKLYDVIHGCNLDDQVIVMNDHVENSDLLVGADILIHPRKNKIDDIILLEAMSCGLPIIGSKQGFNSEYFGSELGGYIANEGNVDDYKIDIENLVYDFKMRYEMGQSNLEVIKTIDLHQIISNICKSQECKFDVLPKYLSKWIQRQDKRQSLGIKPSNKVVLSVGELNRNKNHEVIIRALAQIDYTKVIYLICGQGNFKDDLCNLVESLGLADNVKFLGFRDDIREIYEISDIFAFPSYREGLSVALMEAMSSGLPVVCSMIRGNTDLIDYEKGGYLVQPSNVDEFSNKMELLLENKSLRYMYGNYNAEVIKNFSSDKIMECMKTIYKSM